MQNTDQSGSFEDWPDEEDSSPENRELARTLRELGRLLPGSASVDWEGSRRWCGDVLGEIVRSSPSTQRLVEILSGAPYFVGGDEHHVIRVSSDPNRVYKFTHCDNFGCRSYFSPHDPELTGCHFHGTGNANPFFYLRRWYLLNSLSGYQTRFEGFVPPRLAGHLPRMCISQPEIGGENPDPREIRESLEPFGFVEISQNAFLQRETGLLLTDMAPRNVRIIDGIPVPFDAIAQIAPPAVLDWVNARLL